MAEPKRKHKGLTLKQRELLSGFLFIFPWLVGITWFFLGNFGRSLLFSFSDVNIDREVGGLTTTWIGLGNYYNIFREHSGYMRTMFESVLELFASVPLIIFFSLFMAILLNRQFIGRGLVRAIFFLPVLMASSAIAGTIEVSVAMVQGGVTSLPPDAQMQTQGFNAAIIIALLDTFQMPARAVTMVTTAIGNLHAIIRSAGVQILIFLAALQSIPSSMYEVAQIEGATGYEIFWKITIPMVSPLILTNVVYTVVDNYASSAVVSMAHEAFFREQRYDISAAMSMAGALLTCLVLFVICWIISRYTFYYD
jgi:ABC-type sugar transport system permease subunit